LSKEEIDKLNIAVPISDIANICTGMQTGNNEKYIRDWYEIEYMNICLEGQVCCNHFWVPYQMGGGKRKWYGNISKVINWKNNGLEVRNNRSSVIRNENYFFMKGISWNRVTTGANSFRVLNKNFIFDQSADSIILKENRNYHYLFAFLSTHIMINLLKLVAPTLNLTAGSVKDLPIVIASDPYTQGKINNRCISCINIACTDWNSYETSWDFQNHPFITHKYDSTTISQAYQSWSDFAENQFNQLKQNEEELNRIFIDIYGLQDELTPEVDDKDITISKVDRERDIKSFLSYAVGCTFGRYSLDHPGLIYAGGDFNDKFRQSGNAWEVNTDRGWISSSTTIEGDNIIPIVDDDYFENDIVKRVVDFVKAAFSEETLEENLNYIAETLGSKAGETARQTIRRYFIKDFYKDHVRTYKKRPIYWLFDSGKENGFKALIYLHHYDPQTVARVRTDYLHKLQKNYEAVINQLDTVINSQASDRDKAAAKKRKEKIRKQLEECRLYDQAIAHVANQRIDIDLDDGVKVNYAKFQEVAIPQGEGRKPLKADLLAKI